MNMKANSYNQRAKNWESWMFPNITPFLSDAVEEEQDEEG